MKAPRIFISFLFLCVSVTVFSQKVKVKKGVVLIDKKETPLRVSSDAGIYTLTDSSTGTVFANLKYNSKKIGETSYQWLALNDQNSDAVNEVDMEFVSFTLNMDKAIAEFLMKKLSFFDATGTVNQESITTFFADKKESDAKKTYEEASAGAQEMQAKFAETANLGINVDPDLKRIFRGNIPYTSSSVDDRKRNAETIENMIGTYRFGDASSLVIRDLDNVKVGVVTVDAFGKKATITSQLLSNPIVYTTSKSFGAVDKYATKDFVIEAVRYLHMKGLTLGNQAKEKVSEANQEIREEAIAEYEEKKKNSVNIYEKKGYVIDDKGVKYEGDVTLLFEKIVDPTDPTSSANIVSLDGEDTGKMVKVKYLNEKGKTRFKTVAAKKGARVSIKDGEKETFYQGLKIKSNGVYAESDALNLGNLGAGKSGFYKEILKEGKITLYRELPSNAYIIKADSQEKGFEFIITNASKNIKKLTEYLNGCDVGSEFENADFTNQEQIKELINFYNTSCK